MNMLEMIEVVSIAVLDKNIKDVVEDGGRQPPGDKMKSDLNAMVPNELSDHLAVRVTDYSQSYQSFHEFVVYNCAQLLMRKRCLAVHHVDEDCMAQEGYMDQEAEEPEQDLQIYEGLLTAIKRMTGQKGAGKRR